jgi:hypothetical protein
MTKRERITTAIVACVVHLALLAPTVGSGSVIVDGDFHSEAQAIEDGDQPYADQGFEYPPLAIPLVVGPELIADSAEEYRAAFAWEMIVFDLAIVLVLAFALRGARAGVCAALGAYTIGIFALSGSLFMPESAIDEAPLALARFDLAPALLVLAAVLAREASRSATWSALLSAGVAVKAFPALLYPALLRGERRPRRVALAAVPPLLVAVVIVVAFGDDFWSAVSYHSGRELQIETVAATPFEVAGLLGAGVTSELGSGSYNIAADGADAARFLSLAVMAGLYALLLLEGWRGRRSHLELATVLLAVTVVLAPVLSPQFLIWLLPLSAAAYGLGRENVVLLVGLALTQILLHFYGDARGEMGAEFVLSVAARNLVLLLYLWLVCAPIIRREPRRAAAPQRIQAAGEST